MKHERNNTELAKEYLDVAHASMDAMEQQIKHMSKKMRKVATGLHVAINPNHQVRSQAKHPRVLPLCLLCVVYRYPRFL